MFSFTQSGSKAGHGPILGQRIHRPHTGATSVRRIASTSLAENPFCLSATPILQRSSADHSVSTNRSDRRNHTFCLALRVVIVRLTVELSGARADV
jgi:hypothetical protein